MPVTRQPVEAAELGDECRLANAGLSFTVLLLCDCLQLVQDQNQG